MEKEKLISMTDFVLDLQEKGYDIEKMTLSENTYDMLFKIINYANFLKKKLELWMFIPCDKDGKPLESVKLPPIAYEEISISIRNKHKQFQEALDRVIFDGEMKVKRPNKNTCIVYLRHNDKLKAIYLDNKTIEDLVPLGLTIKKII